LQEIQGRSLAGQDRPGRAANRANGSSIFAPVTILAIPVKLNRIGQLSEGFFEPGNAADQRILLQRDDRGRGCVGWR
jgi:hypothetical protein